MTGTLRQRIHELLHVEESDRGLERALDLFLAVLIVLNVVAVMLETVERVATPYGVLFQGFERFSLAVFLVEYLLRIWSCVEDPRYASPIAGRLRYALTPMALVDLAAFLPGLFPRQPLDLRFVRLARLMRLLRGFKMTRYSVSMQTLGRVLRAKRNDLAVTAFLGVFALIIAACAIYLAENSAQPEKFSSIPASLWWAIITLTTVGYGDVYPVTIAGRMIASVIAVLGIGLFALPAGILGSGFADEMRRRRADSMEGRCPHCGKALDERPASH